jgi:hypothetical protein
VNYCPGAWNLFFVQRIKQLFGNRRNMHIDVEATEGEGHKL